MAGGVYSVAGAFASRQEDDMVAKRLEAMIIVVIISSISGWVTAIKMRRRAKKALGKEILNSELTSLNTWMEVEEAEKRKPLGE